MVPVARIDSELQEKRSLVFNVRFGLGLDPEFDACCVVWNLVEASGDTRAVRQLIDEPKGWWITLHPASPADGVQESPLVVLVGEQVYRFE